MQCFCVSTQNKKMDTGKKTRGSDGYRGERNVIVSLILAEMHVKLQDDNATKFYRTGFLCHLCYRKDLKIPPHPACLFASVCARILGEISHSE